MESRKLAPMAATDEETPVDWPADDDPNYWRWIRQQFLIPEDEAYFNTGTLGACPRQVVEATCNDMRRVEENLAHWEYKADDEDFLAGYTEQVRIRHKAARIMHANWQEIALTQNATMGINLMANGLELGPGEEVLMTDQEHEGARSPWELKAKRTGVMLRIVEIPIPPMGPERLVKILVEAMTPHTRVITLPHISYKYGILMPVAEICQVARERGIFTIIDGAQAVGQLRVDVTKIGCDAYVASPHKWQFSPPGTGLLYIRAERLEEIWTTLAGKNWNKHEAGAFRFMQYGTGNGSILRGLEAGMDFHQSIRTDRIEKRNRELADRLREGLRQIKGVTVFSPSHPSLGSAIITYGINRLTGVEIQDELWNRWKIRVRSQGEHAVRQCVHVHNSAEEIDATLNQIA